MKTLNHLIRRNTKLFLRIRGMFFTSLITPLILILLFITFLGNVFRESFVSAIPAGIDIPERLTEGVVGGWLFSSLLAVCCVTVSFCANMLMAQDRVNGARSDLTVAPVKLHVLSLSYYISNMVVTLIICMIAVAVCFVYLAFTGWYLTVSDVLLTLLDVLLLVMFGTALSSIICYFLSTQGQISAVGAIVSSTYGFICGAYMPISQFSPAIQRLLSFLPGTYATGLLRNHLMQGAFGELSGRLPEQVINALRDSFDNNMYFFDNAVSVGQMYLVLGTTVFALTVAYVLINRFKLRRD